MQKEFEKQYFELEKENWWFVANRDLVKRLFYKYHLKEDSKALFVGCGDGEINRTLKGFKNIYGIDSSEDAVNRAYSLGTKKVILGDAEAIPFRKDEFDAVFCMSVIEHVNNDKNMVDECFRVLKKNGLLIVFTPAFKFLWSEHDIVNHHKKRYSKKELLKLFDKNKFKLKKVSFWSISLFFPVLILKIFKSYIKIKKGRPKPNVLVVPKPINKILTNLLKFENWLVYNDIYLPLGVDLLAVFRKR